MPRSGAVGDFDRARSRVAAGLLLVECIAWIVLMARWETTHRVFLPPYFLGSLPYVVGLVAAAAVIERRGGRLLLLVAWICVVVAPIAGLAALTWIAGETGG